MVLNRVSDYFANLPRLVVITFHSDSAKRTKILFAQIQDAKVVQFCCSSLMFLKVCESKKTVQDSEWFYYNKSGISRTG